MSGVLAVIGVGSGGGSSGLQVVSTRNFLRGFRLAESGTSTTSASTTAVISGGKPPYTGAWVRQSGDAAIANVSPGVTTYFSAYHIGPSSYETVYRYEVTDSLGATAESQDVLINLDLYINVE